MATSSLAWAGHLGVRNGRSQFRPGALPEFASPPQAGFTSAAGRFWSALEGAGCSWRGRGRNPSWPDRLAAWKDARSHFRARSRHRPKRGRQSPCRRPPRRRNLADSQGTRGREGPSGGREPEEIGWRWARGGKHWVRLRHRPMFPTANRRHFDRIESAARFGAGWGLRHETMVRT